MMNTLIKNCIMGQFSLNSDIHVNLTCTHDSDCSTDFYSGKTKIGQGRPCKDFMKNIDVHKTCYNIKLASMLYNQYHVLLPSQ